MKPNWQRAKVLDTPDFTETIGKTVWVRIGRPAVASEWTDNMKLEETDPLPSYESQIVDECGDPIRVGAFAIELLARDESDFAETVELIPWTQFLENCRKSAS